MRKWRKILAAVVPMTLALSFTAFAGEWHEDMAGWWYENDDGSRLANGWHWVDGDGDGSAECYYFSLRGYVVDDWGTADGYEINEDGAWTVDGVVQTKAVPLPNDSEAMALYRAAAEKNAELDSLDADVWMNMSIEADGESMDTDMDVSMKMRGAKTGELEYLMEGSMNMLGIDIPYTAFYTDGYIYTDTMGEKTKQATPVYDAIISANSTMDPVDINEDMIINMEMHEDGENTILTYGISQSKINSYMNELMGMDEFSSMAEFGFEISYDIRSAEGEVVVDSNGYYIRQTVSMDMEMVMTDTETYESESIIYRVDMEMNINNPGEPVEFTLPSTEGYTEITNEIVDLTEEASAA